MNIESKLQRFSDVVQKEAESKKQELLAKIDEKIAQSVSEFEASAKSRYAKLAEEAEVRAEKEKQKKAADAQNEVKRELIKKRVEYSDQIFDTVLSKLLEFFKTPEYEQTIVQSINEYKSKSENPDALVAHIMERDSALLGSIAQKTGIKVDTVKEDFLGGVKIDLGLNKIADCTLKEKYDAEKTGFNKIRIV